MYKSEFGAWVFKGDEQSVAWEYFWCNVVQLSFKGRVKMLYCVLFNKPPKCWWDAMAKRRLDSVELEKQLMEPIP